MKKYFYVLLMCLLAFIGFSKQVPNTTARTKNRIKVKKVKRVFKKGPGFKKYVLGEVLRNIFNIRKVRPFNNAHVQWDEGVCQFYAPIKDIKVGDFLIPKHAVYLIFYKNKLFRIRVLNKFSGKRGRDLDFFTSMRAALTVKYGNAKSVTKIWTRYGGKYIWKKGVARITAVFSYVEFTETNIERLVHKELKKGKKITSSDI